VLDPVKDPGLDVTVNPETALPPVAFAVTGTEAETVDPNAEPVIFVGVPVVGACGTEVVVAEDEELDANAFPYPLVAVTVKV
jgi:hypothetical protein